MKENDREGGITHLYQVKKSDKQSDKEVYCYYSPVGATQASGARVMKLRGALIM